MLGSKGERSSIFNDDLMKFSEVSCFPMWEVSIHFVLISCKYLSSLTFRMIDAIFSAVGNVCQFWSPIKFKCNGP